MTFNKERTTTPPTSISFAALLFYYDCHWLFCFFKGRPERLKTNKGGVWCLVLVLVG